MSAIRLRRLVGATVVALVVAAGCSDGSSRSTPTTTPTTAPAPSSSPETTPGMTFPPGEVGEWQCQDGRRLRLEGDAQWHYEGSPLTPGGANDPRFIEELFRCAGQPVRR